ncbi:phage minor head protein [Phyllobacterium leguminum]|uniref:phage minor head protein n=1 Tax=Phyllobacterium leguminum TaxID=314237 RepID=UPI0015E8B01B|nr:phage minor head protein [Phyllobacterium leguminum]
MSTLEASVRAAFLRFVQTVQSDEAMREIAEFLGRGDVETALSVVDRHIARMAPVLSTVFDAAARDEVKSLADQVKSWAPSTGISFDPTNERAAALMRQNQLEFIREMQDSQRQSIRQALTQGLVDGSGPRGVAFSFRNAIGLTTQQEEAVRNYRRLLESGSREALGRDLRDRRYDRSIERASLAGEPLGGDQIDRMVDRYRQNAIKSRAETIAITETGRAISAARHEAFNQITEEVEIADDQIEREWKTHRDGRERPSHRNMQVRTVQGREAKFVTGNGVSMMRPHDPSGPSSEVIRCRCVQLMRIKKPEAKPQVAPEVSLKRLDDEARGAVLSAGQRDGFEHLGGYDRITREVLAQIDGSANNYVGFTDELEKKLRDPKSALVLHHNHPSSSSLSAQDLMMLNSYPGMHTVWAHGHNGSSYAAWEPKRLTEKVIVDTRKRVRRELERKVNTRKITPFNAKAVETHLVNLALERLGRMKYTAELRGDRASAYMEVQNMVEQILAEVTKR